MINKNRASGFTLVEIMVAIAIIGVLAAVALPSYNKYVEKNNVTNGKLALGQINLELQRYLNSHDTFGSTEERKAQVDSAVTLLDDKAKKNYGFTDHNVNGNTTEGGAAYFLVATPQVGVSLPHLWMSRTGDAYKCSDEASAKAQLKAGKCVKI